MMDMQMLGMMNYISSIMKWQNAGRTARMAAGRSRTEGNSFEHAMRQAQMNYIKEQQAYARSSMYTVNDDTGMITPFMSAMQNIYGMRNPYQNLALLGILSGNYGWNSIL